ncbi:MULTISPECIES: DUF5998 family protein [Arthrobacter]|uniref:DUF5998 family protein n=2 Tax=Arthrobacter TaxID=1663 RepID=A0ABU9KG38_9MICC|nr:DUF5998 family protein [Arthrobacter sp. YJM1]MDP5225847.1 DUF5998 family protein [Arthrobacter sp. YJM1]
MSQPSTVPNARALTALKSAVDKAGFYPRLVFDVVEDALDGREPLEQLVHLETHFDRAEVRRHVTALVLTSDVLVVAHVDDHQLDEQGETVMAQVSTETVPLHQIRSVILGFVYAQPQEYSGKEQPRELTLSIAWSGGRRLDLLPASCGDPQCEADHGLNGTSSAEDIVLRVSAEADGPKSLKQARHFAHALRTGSTGSRVGEAPEPRPVLAERHPEPARMAAPRARGRRFAALSGRFGARSHRQ